MKIRLFPEDDLLQLGPLKGTVCELPSLLLKHTNDGNTS